LKALAPDEGRSRQPVPRVFRRLLLNTLASGVTSSFLWFALTFWVYLETRSVVATGVIGGAFGIASAVLGPVVGTYVDRHRKHRALVVMTAEKDLGSSLLGLYLPILRGWCAALADNGLDRLPGRERTAG